MGARRADRRQTLRLYFRNARSVNFCKYRLRLALRRRFALPEVPVLCGVRGMMGYLKPAPTRA
ncbi:hypothetical protein HMPREF9371_1390 [Neisseria shayeganii 871]|uniref:Uncharacterized protein n=1 Tax=Neisseria shayeganii 871 TaxID=1032488 RepID=G4CID0_9NEIS|nr:hypothetical protein HMPREF9371_1390 [Neisseria shayeganii 871]